MALFDDLLSNFKGGDAARLSDKQRGEVALNDLGSGLAVGGQLMSALSHVQYGRQAQEAARYRAEQLLQNAGQNEAMGQRQAYNANQQAELLASRALAVAAASGGGASDPSVINTIARIAGEGAYRQAVSLYEGQDAARRLRMQAEAAEFSGQVERGNSNQLAAAQFANAGTSLLKGMARTGSLYQKYGGGGPDRLFTAERRLDGGDVDPLRYS